MTHRMAVPGPWTLIGSVAALPGHPTGVYAAAFSADGKMMASGGADFAIDLWTVGN